MAELGSIELRISVALGGSEPIEIATTELSVTAAADSAADNMLIRVDTRQPLAEAFRAIADELSAAPASTQMVGSALDLTEADAEHREHLHRSKSVRAELEPSNHRDGPVHVIIGGRQEGKTTLALRWLTSAPEGVERVLVVITDNDAAHIKRECGFTNADDRVVSWRALRNQGPRKGVQYGIDESAQILTELLGLPDLPHLMTVIHAEPWQVNA